MSGVEFVSDQFADGAGVGFAAGDAHDLAHEELERAAFAVAVVLDGLGVFLDYLAGDGQELVLAADLGAAGLDD